VTLPSPALYPLRVVAAAGVVYGAATLVHGSGFLAVFVAGILIGDRPVPHRREIDEFLASIGSLAEIAMFVALGLTINLTQLFDSNAWFEGLALAALLAFAIRPLVVGALLLPVRLDGGERLFVMWSGLKGAVPILLASLALIADVDDGTEMYGIVFVVVLFSVLVQGTLVPKVAEWLNVPMDRQS
jgi:cell volume regulation protein A